MSGIIEDLRYGLRALAKHRGFAVVAILSLALGIGANTTIFSLINAILLRALPVEQPDRLAAVYSLDSRNPGFLLSSYPNYQDYRDRNPVFSSLALYSSLYMNLSGFGEPRLVMGAIVSGNYFSTLGVAPMLGRAFLPEEDASREAYPVVVVSYRFWARELSRDPQACTRSIQIDSRKFRIVGVAPQGFQGLEQMFGADLWVPMAMYPHVHPFPDWVPQRRALLFSVFGRMKPGVSLPQAEAGLQTVASALEHQYPKDNDGRRIKLLALTEATLAPQTRKVMGNAGLVLLIVSAIVLLIACANVANLLLARAVGRSKEITVRLALGASRWRLIRQLLTESLLLALAGGAAGLLVARWARDLLWSMRPPLLAYAVVQLDLDSRVLLYALGSTLATGILFGLAPALRATRSDLAADLKERAGQAAARGGRWQPRSVLVVCQVAFSVVALVGAGLFVRNIWNADRVDVGFDADRLGIVQFDLADIGYTPARGRDFEARVLDRIATVPGVVSATLSKDPPFRVSVARTVLLEGQESTAAGKGRVTPTSVVWPGYFQTVGIPLLHGRDFSLLDSQTTPRVAIVNQAAANTYWPGEDAVGKRIRFYGEDVPVEVVGVARNASYRAVGEQPRALVYLSLVQYYSAVATLCVRTAGEPEAALGALRREVQSLDRNLMLSTESVRTTIRETLWAERLSAGLLTVFGALALLLALIGIYGVISYGVSQRKREIGVRMALGATASDVYGMILGGALRLVGLGVLVGLVVALASARAVASMLFVVGPGDLMTFLLVPSTITVSAVLACWYPARRATRIDPAIALRDE